MLTTVEVRTDQGNLLSLPMTDISNGFAIANIEGLDPVKATLTSSSFAQLDGAQYQSSRREARNIVLSLDLYPDYSVGTAQELRDELYSFFMTESRVSLRFIKDNGLVGDIVGRVESFDSPRFTQEPEATISVMCFNPDFSAPDPSVVTGSTVEDSTEMVVSYPGSVETGFVFELTVDRDVDEFTIYHRDEADVLRSLQFSHALIAGDVLTISTVAGSKGATLLRSGVESSVLYGVSPYSSWINLYPGNNALRIYAEGAALDYSIEYTPKYGGM